MTNGIISEFRGEAIPVMVDPFGKHWFLANRLLHLLGYSKPESTLKGFNLPVKHFPVVVGKTSQSMNFISVDSAISIAQRSNKPLAKNLVPWLNQKGFI